MSRSVRSGRALGGALVMALLVPAGLGAQTLTFEFDNRPTLRIGKSIRIGLRTKLQTDFHDPSQGRRSDDPAFELAKRRLGVDIDLFDRVAFEIDGEVGSDRPWRDVFTDVRIARPFQIQAGRFKVPFGSEQLTSITNLPFIDRSLVSTTVAPARDTGVMLHGRLGGRWLAYEAGLFRQDGDSARRGEIQGAARTAALRLTTNVGVRGLSLGAAATHGRVPEGLNGLPGRTATGFEFFGPVYVKGQRVRLGAEASWRKDRYQLDAEWMQLRDERRNQGLRDRDLTDAIARGWYLSGTWLLRRAPRPLPDKRFFDRGIGDVEIAARVEEMAFRSTGRGDFLFRTPRAEHVFPSAVRIATVGFNWYLNRWAKILTDVNREAFSDPERRPHADRDHEWRWAIRLQWAM